MYAKAGEYSWLGMNAYVGGNNITSFDLTNGVIGTNATGNTATISPVGNGWYRCTVSRTGGAATYTELRIGNADNSFSFSGNGSDGIYIWGAQLEAGSFATSYLPTVASSVTRSADVASVNTLSPWFNATEGTLFAEAYLSVGGRYAGLYKTGSDNQIEIVQLNSSQINFFAYDTGATQVNSNIAGTAFSTNKIAFAYKANDYASCVNGSAVTTDTSASVPSLNYANINAYQISGPLGSGHIRRIAYYPVRLTAAQLQALTA